MQNPHGAPKEIKNQKKNKQLPSHKKITLQLKCFKNMFSPTFPTVLLNCPACRLVPSRCRTWIQVRNPSTREASVPIFLHLKNFFPRLKKKPLFNRWKNQSLYVCVFSHEISPHQQMGFLLYFASKQKNQQEKKHPLLLWTEAFCPRTVTSPHFSLVKICKTWSPCGCWEILKNTTHFIPYHPWDWYIYLHEWLILMVFM